ncbi:MAG: 50S ribosomal protein L23 [Patescibacteria group bacterium]
MLIKPLVTEKGSYFAASGKYLFEVYPGANKGQIKKAIEAVYGVKPVKVNIVRLPGKSVRYGKVTGTTKDQKKAIVTLRKGETIEVYEGV